MCSIIKDLLLEGELKALHCYLKSWCILGKWLIHGASHINGNHDCILRHFWAFLFKYNKALLNIILKCISRSKIFESEWLLEKIDDKKKMILANKYLFKSSKSDSRVISTKITDLICNWDRLANFIVCSAMSSSVVRLRCSSSSSSWRVGNLSRG